MSKQDKEDAKRWVKNAIAFYQASGKRIALAEYTNPNGQFVQDELYLFVLNLKGTMLAHGVNERFVGEDFSNLKDSDGKGFIKEILDTANTKGSGWVEYKWSSPVTKEVLLKTVYFEKVDDLIICSGVYKHVVHPLKFSCVS
jgi:signal transduction histidine kinase